MGQEEVHHSRDVQTDVFLINEETIPELMKRTGFPESYFRDLIKWDENVGAKAYFFPKLMPPKTDLPTANKIDLVGDDRIWIDGHLEKVEEDVPVAQITVEQDDVFLELTLTRPMIEELYLELEDLRGIHAAERFVVAREGVEDIPGRIAEVGSLKFPGIDILPVTFNYNSVGKILGYAFDFHRDILDDGSAEISFLIKFTDRNLELLVENNELQPGIYATNLIERKQEKKNEEDPDIYTVVEGTIRSISFFPVSGNPGRFERFYNE